MDKLNIHSIERIPGDKAHVCFEINDIHSEFTYTLKEAMTDAQLKEHITGVIIINYRSNQEHAETIKGFLSGCGSYALYHNKRSLNNPYGLDAGTITIEGKAEDIKRIQTALGIKTLELKDK